MSILQICGKNVTIKSLLKRTNLKFLTEIQLYVHFCGFYQPKFPQKVQGLQIQHMALSTTSSSMAAAPKNVTGEDYIYSNNSDDSDFEDSFRTILDDTSIPDDTFEVFDPPPAVPSDVESETENVEPNKNDDNGHKLNFYGLQETPIYNYFGDEEDFQNSWDWAYLPNEQDTGPEM